PAGVGGGRLDGVIQVQLFRIALACKLAQAAQRDLDVARAQLLRVVVVLVGALVPDLDGALVAAFLLAYAYALRVVAIGTKRRSAARAYPFAAAFVAFLLLFKTLFQRFHELVPAHFFDLGLVFGAEFQLEV